MIKQSLISYRNLQCGITAAANILHRTKQLNHACLYCSTKAIDAQHITFLGAKPNFYKKDNMIRVKDDPDTFGSHSEQELFNSDDEKEEKYLQEKPLPSTKLRTKNYADLIKNFIRKRKIQEAIDVLEIKMLKEDRVKPENYIYSLLIGACGRVGYTKKAFSLFNNLKKRGLKVHPSMYTSLFNACANSPWPLSDGLTRARHLRNLIIEKMYEPNESNYNAMIKAFGRCGDIHTAFGIVDEMVSKKLPIKADTLNFLLQACISNKEAGFRHAILVWHKLIKSAISPNLFTFNLMLRCIRDCEIGDLEVTKDAIENIISTNKKSLDINQTDLIGSSSEHTTVLTLPVKCSDDNNFQDLVVPSFAENRPNLMSETPHLGNIIALSEIKTPQDRFLLVGGLSGFIDNMISYNCTPDIKTCTQILDNIPSTLAAEKELLQYMRKLDIKPDIDFFNMLIKKRSLRFDYQSAREVLTMLDTNKLRPDLVTYGVLALGCKTREEALSFKEEMNKKRYRLNIQILGAMLHQACHHNDFQYVLELMEICVRDNIKPSGKFMEKLVEFKKKNKKISNDKSNPVSDSESFKKGWKIFKMRYKSWLKEVTFDSEDEIHPWQQFREEVKTDVNHYRDRDVKTRFKPRHLSLFKQKTSKKASVRN
ncbi:pentatricopeptide repeat-containing protein 1, mitochondrial [Agrilus planipennis]|uniref:Pentatricopeptide repeat-containing protein 1, mitochondrial n=1 Tax=Agrilus planipennis TaxID=224129 RepID=A0A1W4WRQ8_AGRPL|nr:pentatricopeptide repeat-containing protein 1, mitochondrial [Agrilus planipennis]